MSTWQADLLHAARKTSCWNGALSSITNEAHARALIAFLDAFRHDTACSVLAEARTPDRPLHQNARPADILVLHPELGVLFVEVKGWMLDEITDVSEGTVHRRVRGLDEAKDPWVQVSNASQQLQTATRKVYERRRLKKAQAPFFDCVVAFANIKRAEWNRRGFAGALHVGETLFAEDLAQPQILRTALLARMRAKAGRGLPCSPEQLNSVREALGSSAIFRKHNRRAPIIESTLGALIDAAELGLKQFSRQQQDLAEAEFEGRPQIVRGVAGSGKSAVLVKNLANMLDRKRNSKQLGLEFAEKEVPERILVVCFNHSLVPLLKQMLEEACRELMHTGIPEWVDVLHLAGFEWELCKRGGKLLAYQSYKRCLDQEKGKAIAAHYCGQIDALTVGQPQELSRLQYDSIYVDEGQDLFGEEYELLMRLLRPDRETGEKNIVIFYDDAQNLYGRSRPTWSELSIQAVGRSSVMKTCYRNPKQVVEFAFNLLLGKAAETRVLTRGFADLDTLKDNSLVEERSDRWLVHFAPRTDGEVPPVKLFATREEELAWIFVQLEWLLRSQGVQMHEILLVTQEPRRYETDLEIGIRRHFPEIHQLNKPYGEGRSEKDRLIFQEGALTLATVYGAKGYDCPVVLLIGADTFGASVEGRAAFYVAATRAKMRLYVTGLRKPGSLAEEAEAVAALLATPVRTVEEVVVAPPSANPIVEEVQVAVTHAGNAFEKIAAVEVIPVSRAAQPFVPAFRKGDAVLQTRPVRRQGIVLADSTPYASMVGNDRRQSVPVRFADETHTMVWPTPTVELLKIEAPV